MSVESMIRRFVAVWGNPNTEDPDTFLQEYHRSLEGFTEESLDKATDLAIDTLKFWPRPAEIRNIVHEAANKIRPAGPWKPFERTEPLPERTEAEKARSRAMVEAFRQAAAAITLPEKELRKPSFPGRAAFRAMQDASPNTHLHGGGHLPPEPSAGHDQ